MSLNTYFVDNDDDIVMSGLSGRFPESDTIDELRDNLLANIDLISEDDRRWPIGLYGLPTRSGKLKSLDKFDAQFFGLSGKQAEYMDPQGRLLLEVTYEAIVDSGWNPKALRGTNTGVFVGVFTAENEESMANDVNRTSAYGVTGNKTNMLANRLSYIFDFHGPSFSLNTACSSSMLALQQAFSGMKANEFDMAIVGGVNITLRPNTALEIQRLNMLSIDGKCKFLDASANGYVRSEAVSVLVLQKRRNARRVYGTVIHSKSNTDGYKEQGITYPSAKSQTELIEAVLKESTVRPDWVRYVEAHGTGTLAGDQNEVNAICKVYTKNGSDPLLIGSVKSNLGHTEATSGLCSLAKVVIMFENGIIPASLHLLRPNPNIRSLIDGSILAVTENLTFEDSVVAVNSFGFGGSNVHVLLRPHTRSAVKAVDVLDVEIPRLIAVRGRSEQSVDYLLNFIRDNKDKANDHFLALLNDVNTSDELVGMNFSGYVIRDVLANGLTEIKRQIIKTDVRRPLWFIFSGMGTQWTGMAKSLMAMDVFSRSIRNSAQILKPYGMDLLELVVGDNDELLVPIMASSLGITAIQIALIDVIKSLELHPDGYIGHSLGELSCAYMDGTLDAREVILFSYWRTKCIEQAQLPRGLMAAVGLTWEETIRRCPAGVVAACHNGRDSVTISGAYDTVDSFLLQLKKQNIFTKKVLSSDIAFHSPSMKPLAPQLLKQLRSVSASLRLRSSKWISTSVPSSRWSTPEGQYFSADYLVNNIISPVLFQEAMQYIPDNAIIVEIAPDSLFKNVIKRSLSAGCSYVGLMKRNHQDNLGHLLTGLGQLFILGLNPKLGVLYPKISYPVKRGTQSLGSLVRWDHSDSHLVTLYPNYFNQKFESNVTIEINFHKDNNEFYLDHCIDGRVLFPTTGYLWLVWDEFAKRQGTTRDQLAVIFENIQLLKATIVNVGDGANLTFRLNLSEINGQFCIYEANQLTVSGHIRVSTDAHIFLPLRQKLANIYNKSSEYQYNLNAKSIYKELDIWGYNYGHYFQPIMAIDTNKNVAKVRRDANWVAFADAMLHFLILSYSPTRDLYLPTSIAALHCDPRLFAAKNSTESKLIVSNFTGNYCLADGLELYGLKTNCVARRQPSQELVVEKYVWIPYRDRNGLSEQMQQLSECYVKLLASLTTRHCDKQLTERMNELLTLNELTANKLVYKDIIETINISTIQEPANQRLITNDGLKACEDFINNLYLSEDMIRPAVDIILENCNQKSNEVFNVLEINLNQNICYQSVAKYLNDSFYNLKIKYKVYNPYGDHHYSDNDQFDKIDINLSMTTKLANTTNPLNLVIIRDQYPTSKLYETPEIDWENIFTYINTNLEINGFVVILKRNKYLEIESNLFKQFEYNDSLMDTNKLVEMAKITSNLSLVSHRDDCESIGISSVLLFKKLSANKSTRNANIIIPVTHQDISSWFETLKNEFQVKSEQDSESLIWLVSESGDGNDISSGIVGLVNCLRKEIGGHRIRCISAHGLAHFKSSDNVWPQELIDTSMFDNQLVMNIYKNHELGSYRHLSLNHERLTKTRCAHAMAVQQSATKDAVIWVESKHNLWPQIQLNGKQSVLINVYFAALNYFQSTRKSTISITNNASKLTGVCSEFSGIDKWGDRVFGIQPNACLATTLVYTNPNDYIPVPDGWSLAQACTVPIAYGTAYWALVVRSQLQSRQTILIPDGDSYMGWAAIAVCLSRDCEVFATVDTIDAKKQLMTDFASLDDLHVINTSVDCVQQIIFESTAAKGVDIVYNHSHNVAIESSFVCVKHNGRYIEAGCGKSSISQGLFMNQNMIIDRIVLEDIFDNNNEHSGNTSAKYQILGLLEEGIGDNVVKPFATNHIFPMDKCNEAIKFVNQINQYKQKVLIKVREEFNEDIETVIADQSIVTINAIHNTRFPSDVSFIITGGLGGFGLELANWLAERGARHLVLTSRSGIRNEFQKFMVKRVMSLGVNVIISKVDASDQNQLEALIKETINFGPIYGIFSLAMVLSNGLLQNQTQESMLKVFAPKVQALLHLDTLSRVLCPDLRYFVAFSSAVAGRGNTGQCNYGYANSYMERLCEQRRGDGLPGLAIQWGAIADVGVVAEKFALLDSVAGTVPQRIHSCLSLMNHFLRSPEPVISSLLRYETKVSDNIQKQDVIGLVSSILGVRDVTKISKHSKLSELGMDSLIGIEIKQSLEQQFQLDLTLQQISDLTFGDIIIMNANKD